MAQHDYTIANQGFPAFRSDLNDALAAIVSNNSGATEPSTMFAHQLWVDTATNPSILKMRNSDNDAWITIGTIDQTGDKFVFSPAGGSASQVAYGVAGEIDTGMFFPASDTIAFAEGGAEAMRITSAGEVLVGGTTDISSTSGVLTIQRAASPTLNFFRNDTTVGSGDALGLIGFYGNDTTSNTPTLLARITATASGTHAAGDNPTDLVFGTTPDGSATVAEKMRLTEAGYLRLAAGGIQFNGDTAAANSLDDYEEGTWTPTDVSGASLSLTVVGAVYVKIGQLCMVTARITYPSTANGSVAAIGGLPFTTANLAGGPGQGAYITNSSFGSAFYLVSTNNSTNIIPVTVADANITNSSFSTKFFGFTAVYRTT